MRFQFTLMVAVGIIFFAVGLASAQTQAVSTNYDGAARFPDLKHANDPLPDGVLAWDALLKSTEATNGQGFARFIFSFTNVAKTPITIFAVRSSCGCTTAELPPTPWEIPGGTSGSIKFAVNLAGKAGMVTKTATVTTDQGQKELTLRINIASPAPARMMSESDRAAALAAAKVDRQAVFKDDCANCHAPKLQGQYAMVLYQSACAICHESPNRASVVPDLSRLKAPTNEEYWHNWIAASKPGSLMPAFAQSAGGPLNDVQIASLAAYLNGHYPSSVTAH